MTNDRTRFALVLPLLAAFAAQALSASPYALDGKGALSPEGEIATLAEALDLDSGPDGAPAAVAAASWDVSGPGGAVSVLSGSFPRQPGQGLAEAPQGTGPPKYPVS